MSNTPPPPAEDPELSDDALFQSRADRAYAELLARVGEQRPEPRLTATRRAVELLGDPHRAYPIIHVAGTNGKTSTSRMIESLLRAHGLRTGLMTSPHLVRVNERISIDGQPISNEAFATNWEDIKPYLGMADAEMIEAGEPPLTFFEAFTVLAFACFADAPVDVAVLETGMGGEWDSSNVADGQVAVITPISLDHTPTLGTTIAEIARTKAGIIKPAAVVVSSVQTAEAMSELRRAAALSEASFHAQNDGFALNGTTLAVGGQVLTVTGRAGEYRDVFLPLFGDHQADNAALAIAAVESFLGDGTQAIPHDVVAEGLGSATSPGRLQVIGADPTVVVDAAHNPSGAEVLVKAVRDFFTFEEVAVVIGVLEDKDADGIIRQLAPLATQFHVTASGSPRALSPDDLAYLVRDVTGADSLYEHDTLDEALSVAREWAAEAPNRAVLVTGSITLIGDAMALAAQQGWLR